MSGEVLSTTYVYVLVQADGTLAAKKVFESRIAARLHARDESMAFGTSVKIRRAKLSVYGS